MNTRHPKLRAASFLFATLFTLNPDGASAQPAGCEITGEVRDGQGGVIASARVSGIETRTGLSSVTTTGAAGTYTLTNLRPGLYSVTIEADGFKRLVRDGVRLSTGERVRIDVALEVGEISESISVTEDAPLLRTDAATLGHVIQNRAIVGLPLNGRSFVSLVALAPGVALPPGSAFPRVNGGRPRVNEYLFDGISVLQPEPGQVAFFPIIDAIQEFKVVTNSPAAEFGRFDGGVINLTTRSGTNEFHGTLFEFLRNETLNARNLFAPRTAADPNKPVFRRNQFGGVFGGPIVRGKTFFFTDFQGTRQNIGRVRISTVPTLLQREGIFTEPVAGRVPTIYDPLTTRTEAGGAVIRDPLTGNSIPAARVDPVATELLLRYPLATSMGTANNYRRVANEPNDQNQFDVRLDHRFSASDVVYGRYSYAADEIRPVTPLPEGSGNLTTGVAGPTNTLAQSFVSNYVHVFNAHVVNELRSGYTRRSVARAATSLDAPPAQSLGLPGLPANGAFQNTLPTFAIDGFQQLGSPASTASNFRTDVTQLVDTLSFQKGSHTMKAGLDFRWERLDIIQPPAPTGLFNFNTLFTNLPGASGTGNSLASFLLGQVSTFSIDLQEKAIRPRAVIQEYFVQDDWRVSPRLTVNAGLRYTLNFPSTEADDQGAVFNFATQQLDYLGRNGFPRSARQLHKGNFGSRLGAAYQPIGRTVVRSAYALVWFQMAGISTSFINPQFPFVQSVGQRTLDNLHPAFVLSQGPSVTPIPPTPEAGLGQGVYAVDRNLGSGYAQHWNFAIQREITSNLVWEIAYTGSKITHVGMPDVNLNQLTVDQLRLGAPLLERVPNPFFGQIPQSSSLGDPTITRSQLLKPFPRFTAVDLYRNNAGDTNFHGLQVKLEKRFSQGVSFLLSYTRGKLIDEASSVFNASIQAGAVESSPVADAFNRKLERDVSNGDIPNIFTASWTYEIPFGRAGSPVRGFVDRVLGGWQLAGLISVQSGLPLTISQATNFNAFAGFGTQRPDRLAGPALPASQRSTAQWFDTSAFQAAPQFTIGNSSRNPVRGPGYRNIDIALSKRTPVREHIALEFRAEVFNLTNTPPLGSPNMALGTPGFGAITSAGDPRVSQLALKLHF
jgi:hypothetical protein